MQSSNGGTKAKQRFINRERRIHGRPHVTGRGEMKPGKHPPPAMAICKCKYKCRDLSQEQKERLFIEFYQLSYEQQGTYLMNRIDIANIARRRHGNYSDPSESKRQATMCYTVPSGNGLVQVCAKIFKELFGVSNRRLQTLNMKKKLGNSAYNDERGRNPSSHIHKVKYTEEDHNLVREHIQSFPKEESHYGRNASSKLYLSADLNVHRMYHAFQLKYPESHVQYKYYQGVFKNDFPNVSFGKPKTDTCRTCDHMHVQRKASPSTKDTIEKQLELHQRKAEKALSLLSQDIHASQMPSSDVLCVSMDMQQVISTPTLTHSAMFYSRQLSNFNLCVNIGDTGDSYMCMWHEGIAGRGGNEIASCLFKVLTSHNTTKNRLTLWCDNCAGQNKNRMILMALVLLATQKRFQYIDMKFLVSGHSYMPCDRDFGVIEKRKKVCKTMVPDDLHDIVKSARIKKPFKVIPMQTSDFLEFASAADTFLNTTKLQISKASWIQVSSTTPTTIKTRHTFNDMEEWTAYQVLKKGKKVQDIILTSTFTPDNAGRKITAEKKKDLLAMLEYMEPKYHDFYKALCK